MDVKIIACVLDEIVVETDQEIVEQLCEMLESSMLRAAIGLLAPVPVEVVLLVFWLLAIGYNRVVLWQAHVRWTSGRGLCDYASSNFGEKMTIADAEQFQDAFFDAYPQLDAWCQDQMDSDLCWVEEDGVWETRTLCNRIRLWMDLPGASELVNTPIQGTAADIIKIALGNVVKIFEGMDVKIIACIHDEIVVETDQEIAEQVCEMLESSMVKAASALLAPVPVEVDLVVSDCWQ